LGGGRNRKAKKDIALNKLLSRFILFAGLTAVFPQSAGAQWVKTNGLVGQKIYCLDVSGEILFAGTGGGDLFLSSNNGTNWIEADSGLRATAVHSFAVKGDTLYAGTDSGVFFTANNGTSWAPVDSSLRNSIVWSLAVSGESLFAGTYGDGIFISSDNGKSWNAFDSGLTDTHIHALAVSGGAMVAGTDLSGIFLSTDNGKSWNSAVSGVIGWTFAVNGSTIFAGTMGSGIFMSTNNGTSWSTVDSGLTSTLIWSLAMSGSAVFAGTYGGGIFLSTDNGISWNAVDSGFATSNIQSLAVSGGAIFAGTDGEGIWRRPLSEMIGSMNAHPRSKIPDQARFKIGGAGAGVVIECIVPHPEKVAVAVYDLMGGRITSLVDRYLDAGSYRYRWDARACGQRCYVLRMQVGATVFMYPVTIAR
jgi:photosystem II stability/assembly factor-like uncharacterized protein